MDFGGAYSAFSQIPLDWLIIAVLFIVIAADALRGGTNRAAALALSFPVSYVLFQMIAHTFLLDMFIGQFSATIEQAVVFAILETIVFVCVHQMLFSYDRYSSLISATVAGLAAVIVVLVIWMQMPLLQSIWHFDGQIQAVFGASYAFFWIVGSYLALAFIGS